MDKAVEAVAPLMRYQCGITGPGWDDAPEPTRESWRKRARAVLEGAIASGALVAAEERETGYDWPAEMLERGIAAEPTGLDDLIAERDRLRVLAADEMAMTPCAVCGEQGRERIAVHMDCIIHEHIGPEPRYEARPRAQEEWAALWRERDEARAALRDLDAAWRYRAPAPERDRRLLASFDRARALLDDKANE